MIDRDNTHVPYRRLDGREWYAAVVARDGKALDALDAAAAFEREPRAER
jgi:hypothetical protein